MIVKQRSSTMRFSLLAFGLFCLLGSVGKSTQQSVETQRKNISSSSGSNTNAGVRSPCGLSSSSPGATPGEHWPPHVPFRVALLVVWMGYGSAPASFPFFLSSVAANMNLVDLLLFHENNKRLEETVLQLNAPNVYIYDCRPHGITNLLAEQLGQSLDYSSQHITKMKLQMRAVYSADPKSILELRPSFGSALLPYIQSYTHWAYLDVDQILGDLPAWMSWDEFMDFDVVTYSAGDINKVYIRGPLTMFNLSGAVPVTAAWKQVPYLGIYLKEFIEYKHSVCLLKNHKGAVLYRQHFPYGCKMIPDESVFSQTLLTIPGVRIKYSNKDRADPGSNPAVPRPSSNQIYYVDGAIRFCTNSHVSLHKTHFVQSALHEAHCDVLHPSPFRKHMALHHHHQQEQQQQSTVMIAPHAVDITGTGRRARRERARNRLAEELPQKQLSSVYDASSDITAPIMPLSVDPTFPGMQKVVHEIKVSRPLTSTQSGCEMGWIMPYGRCYPGLSRYFNIIYRNQKWFHQKFLLPVASREECMIMHFRRWKTMWPHTGWLLPPPGGGGRYVITVAGFFQYEVMQKNSTKVSSTKLGSGA
jgi:hypothetical protein